MKYENYKRITIYILKIHNNEIDRNIIVRSCNIYIINYAQYQKIFFNWYICKRTHRIKATKGFVSDFHNNSLFLQINSWHYCINFSGVLFREISVSWRPSWLSVGLLVSGLNEWLYGHDYEWPALYEWLYGSLHGL